MVEPEDRTKEIGEDKTEVEVPEEAEIRQEVKVTEEEELPRGSHTPSTGDQDTPQIHHLSVAGPIGFLEARRDGVRTQPHVHGRTSRPRDEEVASSEFQK